MNKRNVLTCTGGGGTLIGGCTVPKETIEYRFLRGKPAPVRESETGRARNWTMPPLRPEREQRARTNRASVDNTCKGFDRRENQRCAFTMAEILLSLTIIGVVAAITLPSLTGNINERTWNTQRKALYARFSQAISLMPSLNGYGTLDATTDTAAETFIANGLSKVLKINNICGTGHLGDCGIPEKFTDLRGNKVDFPTDLLALNSMFNGSYSYDDGYTSTTFVYSQEITNAAAFETANGESIAVYYNPRCQSDMQEYTRAYSQPKMCANFIYDLNGSKGPNTVGKDIGFITALYPVDAVVVAPMPLVSQPTASVRWVNASSECTKIDTESRLPNREELSAMFYNRLLLGLNGSQSQIYWASTNYSATEAWYHEFSIGRRFVLGKSNSRHVLCVKR